MNNGRSPIDFEESRAELHDLCQPLTALQCRLEMTRFAGHEEPLEVAIEDSLQQTRRLFEVVARMRERLLRLELAAEQPAFERIAVPGQANS
ncbi:MAG: hypothetical protein WBY53_08910 [Acidobacteriaceae bacterium]